MYIREAITILQGLEGEAPKGGTFWAVVELFGVSTSESRVGERSVPQVLSHQTVRDLIRAAAMACQAM
ncbi:hypothetical protein BSQ44_04490 [Aquibium oceanicum]|uniref:Uncharacterized protein n=1 Tax=Aquibium oceanicum TaxID=1670800 RepID=A0A1L3SMU7_9HYPH|nr:hypothetical protein BSQ44_04490 [Aquibium oceanicum]